MEGLSKVSTRKCQNVKMKNTKQQSTTLLQKILTKKVDAPVLAKSDDNVFPREDSVIFVHSFQIQSLNFKPMTMMTMIMIR